jgi:hypothetical protein
MSNRKFIDFSRRKGVNFMAHTDARMVFNHPFCFLVKVAAVEILNSQTLRPQIRAYINVSALKKPLFTVLIFFFVH